MLKAYQDINFKSVKVWNEKFQIKTKKLVISKNIYHFMKRNEHWLNRYQSVLL